MKTESRIASRDSLLIFLVGVIIFTIGPGQEFVGFQARFALFAQNMLREGVSFFPTTYQGPYPDYPVMSTIMIYLVSLLFGGVTPFSAILPTAIASSLILVMIYRTGAIRSREWGLYAVLFALGTYSFLCEARTISLDQYTSLVTAACFYLAYSATVFNARKRLWFIPLLLIGGFAFRGSIGLIIPAAVVCGYYLCAGQLRLLFLMGVSAAVLLAACNKGLLLAAYHQGGEEFVKQVVFMQAVGRMDTRGHGARLFYYWFAAFALYSISYPVALVAIGSRMKQIFRRENADYRLLGYLAVWIVIVITGMSIPGAKKDRYILPIVPALALAAAYIFIDPSINGVVPRVRKVFVRFCYLSPSLAFVGALIAFAAGRYSEPPLEAYYLMTAALMLLLVIAALLLRAGLRESPWRGMAGMAVAAAVFVGFTIGDIDPMCRSRERTGPFVKKIMELEQGQPAPIVFYQIGPDSYDIKFAANYPPPVKPDFIQSPDALIEYPQPAYFITKSKYFGRIPEEIFRRITVLHRGRIGHRECVVFSLRDEGD